jgi:hypothetical protein
MKAKRRSAPGRPKEPPQRTVADKKPDRDVAPSKPELVQASQARQPTNGLHLRFFTHLRPNWLPTVQHRLSHRENRDDAEHADYAPGRPDYP